MVCLGSMWREITEDNFSSLWLVQRARVAHACNRLESDGGVLCGFSGSLSSATFATVDGVQVPPLFISLFQDPQRTFEEFVVLLVPLQD